MNKISRMVEAMLGELKEEEHIAEAEAGGRPRVGSNTVGASFQVLHLVMQREGSEGRRRCGPMFAAQGNGGGKMARWNVVVIAALAYGMSGCAGSWQNPAVLAEERAKDAAALVERTRVADEEWEKERAARFEKNDAAKRAEEQAAIREAIREAAFWKRDEAAFAEVNKSAGVVFPEKMLDTIVLRTPNFVINSELNVRRLIGRLKRVVDGDDMMTMGAWSKDPKWDVYGVTLHEPGGRTSSLTLTYYKQRRLTMLGNGAWWMIKLQLNE